ncbi:hypothetical protein NKH18_48985 [Streptomyces sp. M10(2022)]
MINLAAEPASGIASGASYEGLVKLAGDARALLKAVAHAGQPGPSVVDIAEQIRHAIATGAHRWSSPAGATRIATDLGVPVVRVELALEDLVGTGLIRMSAGGRVSVPGDDQAAPTQRAREIADWITELIQAGVYPAGTHLPKSRQFRISLVSSSESVRDALHLLQKEGLSGPGKEPSRWCGRICRFPRCPRQIR